MSPWLQRNSVTLGSGGNDARWKAWKTAPAVFQASHRAWKSLCDFHIPTARLRFPFLFFLFFAAPTSASRPHRQRRSSGVDVDARQFAFFAPRPPRRAPRCVAQRQRYPVQPLLSQPHMQLAVELVRQLHLLPRVALPARPRRQLDPVTAELHHVVLRHYPLVAQTEQPVPVQLLA